MTTDHDLGGLLHFASNRLATLGDRVLAHLNVTSAQWKVMVVLARRGDLRVSTIVELLQHDQAAVSRLVTRMQRSRLVRRRDDPTDARAGIVQLTTEGWSTFRRCETRLRTVMADLERSLTPTERLKLHSLLTRFTSAIDDALRRRPLRRRAGRTKPFSRRQRSRNAVTRRSRPSRYRREPHSVLRSAPA